VRAAQHSRSLPLIVIGILLVNYGVGQFDRSPVRWQYGAPLAFILLWVLANTIEGRVGVGRGRADYLVAAGFVFTATSLVTLRPFTDWLNTGTEVTGVWIIIIGVALLGLAAAGSDLVLAVAGSVVAADGIQTIAYGSHDSYGPGIFNNPATQATHFAITGWVGAALVVAGLLYYRVERRAI